jgi:nucleotide-binding universal stress UspA family protein
MYPAVGNDLTLETWRQQWQEFERQGLEVLQSYAQAATKAGVSVQFQQITGSPARTICKVAREWQADLIVIGHRGRSGLSEMLLGSVSNYVVHHARCSVLLVR